MKRCLIAVAVSLSLLVLVAPAAAFHKPKTAKITHTVTGVCEVTQTLMIEGVRNGETVFFEFLPSAAEGEGSSDVQSVTSTTQTFTYTRQFQASENGTWIARAELYYSNTKPPYKSSIELIVSC